MSQTIKKENKKDEATIAPATLAEESKDEYTIRLSAEGQIHLVELLENPAPLPEIMQKAKEESSRFFGNSL